ncbi:MAG: ABC transporter substrate-binding protein [Pseudobacteriovorax sp.]|nr:ABC transporter substrate-binding protein [Pseudobacteriovorax sp.]
MSFLAILFSLLLITNNYAFSKTESISVGWESAVRSFDPRSNSDANSQYLESLLHCSLFKFDEKGNIIPGIALSMPKWDALETKLSVKFGNNIKYSDGSRLSAADIVATYKTVATSTKFARHGAFKNIKDVIKVADDTVQFIIREKDATFLSNLSIGILREQDIVKQIEAKKFQTCGPYILKDIGVSQLHLIPNKFYSQKNSTNSHAIMFKFVKNEKTRLAKLRAGELDIVQNLINRDMIRSIQTRYPNLKIQKKEALKTTYIGFNFRNQILRNKDVRKAIDLAIDRDSIIKFLLAGLATPTNSMLLNSSPFHLPLPPTQQNLTAAGLLLDKAGYPMKSGKRFTISYKTTTNSTRIQIAKAIASQLKKIGIDLKIEALEWGRFSQDVKAGRVEMWGLTWVGFKDPDILRFAFATESFPPNGANRGFFSHEELDRLLALGRKTTDQAKRVEIYHKAQEIIAEEKPYIFLWHELNFAVLNKKIENFVLYADGRFDSLVTTKKK